MNYSTAINLIKGSVIECAGEGLPDLKDRACEPSFSHHRILPCRLFQTVWQKNMRRAVKELSNVFVECVVICALDNFA